MKINELLPLSHSYTKILHSIASCPDRLYRIGELPDERIVSVAIVGTRKPSPYGREVTELLAGELAKKGVVIVSGLALGIDTIAHRAAIDAGGKTIAVLGNGLSSIYPSTNRSLAEDIIRNGGALLSEYSEGTPPIGFRFLERNRIVSGLSDAVVITEAAARSGTLNTASHALDQGKDLFVVPGNITSPLSAGCNALLKQGAIPITKTADILERIAPEILTFDSPITLGANPPESILIKLMRDGIRDGDELLAKSGLGAQEYASALTMMEIEGTVRSLGANKWTLR